ncbi:MAG: ABC transporter permease [Acidobacteria bacterium]|nr:ABC transporter permease [Acidobacteriota bacterium]
MHPFLQDLKQALRGLLKAPAFTLTALLTLALGIGANTAMFSAIRGLLIKPLPFREADRLVALWESRPLKKEATSPLSAPNFFDWKDRATRGFEGISVVEPVPFDLAGGGPPQRISALRVSSNFFDLLGIQPRLGHGFRPDMERPGNERVVLLSHGLWKRRFGADPALIGHTLTLSGVAHTVLGVMPEGFLYPVGAAQDLYLPFPRKVNLGSRNGHRLMAIARLRPGVTHAAAQSELAAIAADLARTYPDTNEGNGAVVRDLHDDLLGESSKPLLLLLGAVSLLLLIACTNVANLFLLRAISREREVAIRAALGATRGQLLSRFFSEGLLLGFMAALVGLGVASATLRLLPALLPNTGDLNQVQRLGIDPWTLAYTLGLSLLTSFAFALVPAWQLREAHLSQGARMGAKGSSASGRLRSSLVVTEVALAMLLLMTTGLLLRSFFKALATHPGFESKGVIAFEVDLASHRYPKDAQQGAFQAELERRLGQIPGIASVGSALFAPMSGSSWTTSLHIGPTATPSSRWPHRADVNTVSPGFFETLNVPLRAGRTLQAADTAASGRVVVVNESFARMLAPTGQAVGLKLLGGMSGTETSPEGTLWEVVGVVGDIRQRSLETAAPPMVFVPLAQSPMGTLAFFVKSPASFAALSGAIRAAVHGLDAEMALDRFEPFENQVRRSLGDRRQTLVLLTAFASLALLLAGVGIYGVIAYGVSQRTREIGIRMALGAQIRAVLRLVMGQGLRLTLLGIGIGLLGSVFTGRLLSNQLVGLGPMDPLTSLAVASLLCSVAILACLAPALRAARVDPAIALRSE